MPLDIDGAGRSSALACLPTARGTVAPTRGQVPGGVLLSRDHYKVSSGRYWVVWILGGSGGSRAPFASEFQDQGAWQFSGPNFSTQRRWLQDFQGRTSSQGPPPRGQGLGLLQTSFRLPGPSAYTNEKVLLLT